MLPAFSQMTEVTCVDEIYTYNLFFCEKTLCGSNVTSQLTVEHESRERRDALLYYVPPVNAVNVVQPLYFSLPTPG